MRKLGYRVSALCAFVGICISAGNALASEPASPSAQTAPTPPTATEWYGMPTAIVAGVSSASILTGVLLSGVDNVATTQSVLIGAGMAGLYLGGPIVHWSNGQIQRGFAVLGLHTGLGLLGGFIGMASCSDDCAGGDLLGLKRAGLFSFGAILGTVVSNAIDIGVFTYKDRNPTIVTGRQRFPFTMSPQLMMGRDSGGIGLAGTF